MGTLELIVQIRKVLEIEILYIYSNVPELFVTRDPLLTKASALCSPGPIATNRQSAPLRPPKPHLGKLDLSAHVYSLVPSRAH